MPPGSPETPPGRSRNEFGTRIMKWGTGDGAARARIATITVEELAMGGVTLDMAIEWRNFYRDEMRRNPTNPSAAGRADLLDHVVGLLGGGSRT